MIQSLPVAHQTGSDDKSLALLIEQLTAKLHAGEPVLHAAPVRETAGREE